MKGLRLAVIAGQICTAAACVVLGARCLSYQTPVIAGTWMDSKSDYQVTFYENGMYEESLYRAARPFEVKDGRLILFDQLGSKVSVPLVPSARGELTLPLNGEVYQLHPVQARDLGEERVIAAPATPADWKYKLDASNQLELWADGRVFRMTVGTDMQMGTWAYDARSAELALFNADSKPVAIMRKAGSGYATGFMDSRITVSDVYDNALAVGGYTINGVAEDTTSRLRYTFNADTRTVTRTAPNGDTCDFLYAVSDDGIISLVDLAGVGIKDTLWLDTSSTTIYKYVFESDEWAEFLRGDAQ